MDERNATPVAPTRLIAMGQAPLMEGFRLIGIETHPDADAATVERTLEALVRGGEAALVFLEHDLARGVDERRQRGHWLEYARNEGARIVITEIPSLATPETYAPAVDQLVRMILGAGALAETPDASGT